jgi:hypothetical protein
MRWTGHMASIGERSAPYRVLVGKPPGGKRLARPSLTVKENVKVEVKAIELEGMNWINLAQYGDRCCEFVDTLMNLQFK